MSIALIPVKALAASKSRLLPDLGRAHLDALALAMLEDMIGALKATPSVARIVVATPDDRVAELTQHLGAEAFHGPDPGLNEAIDAAGAKLGLPPDVPLLTMLGDIPSARAEEIETLFDTLKQMREGPAAVLAPSGDGGTSALLRRPYDAIASCFGRQSAQRHRETAQTAEVAYEEQRCPSLLLDLDCSEDISALLASDAQAIHTRALLAEIGWPRNGLGS